MRRAQSLLAPSFLVLAASAVAGQSPTTMFRAGDPIIGMGRVDKITDIRMTDSRLWVSVAEIVNADVNDNLADECLVRSGFLAMRESMPLAEPATARLVSWGAFGVSDRGDLAIEIRGQIGTGGSSRADGLYWNFTKIGYKGDPLPLPELGPNSVWDAVDAISLAGDHRIVALIEINNTAVLGNREDALMRFRVDAAGHVLEQQLLATKAQFLDVLGTVVDTLGSPTSPLHSLAANSSGHFICPVQALGRNVMMLDMETVVGEDNQPSPVAGRTWGNNAFALAKVAINDRGEYAYTGTLLPLGGDNSEPTNFLIVKNGEKFVQSGDVIPSLSPAGVGKASATIFLANTGDLFWRATLDNPSFVRNFEPLVKQTITVVNGGLVTAVAGGDNCFSVSPSGRYFAGRVTVQGVGDTVVFIDFGLIREIEGCRGINTGRFQHLSGEARLGEHVRLGMTDGPAPGALPIVVFSPTPIVGANGCGPVTPFGELLLGAPVTFTQVLPEWNGVDPAILEFTIPNNIALVDAVFVGQGVFRSPGTTPQFRLTSAVQLEIGPP